MPVTLRDVASNLGVSTATVSLVLAGKTGRYSEATRDRVLEAAKRLGYRPNASSRFMQDGRFGMVGLLNPTDRALILPPALLEGATRALEAHDSYLLHIRIDRERLRRGELPTALAQRMTDGFLVNLHLSVKPEEEEAIDALGVPCVWMNHKHGRNCVHPDDIGAGSLLVDCLLQAGHRRIAWADCQFGVMTRAEHYSAGDRRIGCQEACARAGLPCLVHLSANRLEPEERVAWARTWLERPDRPTGVVTGNEWTAAAIATAAVSLGLSIPRDLSLVTVGELPFDRVGLVITTALVPQQACGARAADLLLARIAGQDAGDLAEPVAFTLAPGASVGPPPAQP